MGVGVKKRATPSTARITEAIVSRTAQISNRNTSRAARRDNAKAKGATNIFSSKNPINVKLDSLFGTKQSAKVNELRVTKLLCQKEHRSFLFSPEFLKMLRDAAQKSDDDVEPLFEIAYFAKTSFFVILNRNNGLISLDAAIPVNFRTETAGGMFTLPIDRPTTIPSNLLEIVRQVISTISIHL